ncbi:hypothetical protein PI125_g13912 [Phytophthora idaei]|nr:hypothetical protein PI125_g13912 [Phytophthora idaei]
MDERCAGASDNHRGVTEIQAGRELPRPGYEDLLSRPVQVTEPGQEATADDRNRHALEQAFLTEQKSYLRDLFNQTLSHGYMTQMITPLAPQPVPAFLQQLAADFGQNNDMGMVDMIQEFEAVLSMHFGSVAELFQRLRSVRNRLNRQGQETLQVHLIPSQLMIGKVLALVLNHLWGPSVSFSPDEFTLEKVEKKMKASFGNKSPAEIQAMGKTGGQPAPVPVPVNHAAKGTSGEKKGPSKKSGKRKAAPLPMDDERLFLLQWRSQRHEWDWVALQVGLPQEKGRHCLGCRPQEHLQRAAPAEDSEDGPRQGTEGKTCTSGGPQGDYGECCSVAAPQDFG